jgi:hypothetical protein
MMGETSLSHRCSSPNREFESVEDLSKALTGNGFRIGDWAADILKRTPLADTETEIELVLVTAADLGFTAKTRRDAVCDRANELGLDLL